MTLDNLIGINLERIATDPASIQRLITAAERNLKDAHLQALSMENRFDAAYKAIMQMANAALQTCGYRTLTSKPGHHQTMIQSLPKTVGLDGETMVVLDALRKQRNVADYSGDPVTDKAVQECIIQAENLHSKLHQWLRENHGSLLKIPE